MSEVEPGTAIESAPFSVDDLRALRRAARIWLLAQLILPAGEAGYALAFWRGDRSWAWWLFYAAGPRFTTEGPGIRSTAVALVCAAGWAWACWLLGGIGGEAKANLARVVRWGGLLLLFAHEFTVQAGRLLGLRMWYLTEATATVEVLLILAIALHLRNIGSRLRDRVLDQMLDPLLWVVVFEMVIMVATWVAFQPSHSTPIALGVLLAPNLRALVFVMVMARIFVTAKTQAT